MKAISARARMIETKSSDDLIYVGDAGSHAVFLHDQMPQEIRC
ncbi:hypothetical protein [Halobacillus sp. A1]|nr:hypothetical protein [Halobacillus sp. A1]